MRVIYKFRGYPVIAMKWVKRGKYALNENGIVVHVEYDGNNLLLNDIRISKEDMKKLSKKGSTLHAITEEGLIALEIRSRSYYKLRALDKPVHPTLEIDGVHMHRISQMDPWTDSLIKVKPLRIRKSHRVLDTCMGLGYTAIAAKNLGAQVLTVEKSEEVLELSRWNPWSRELEDVNIYLDDVSQLVIEFKDESFDRIIHDPPAFYMAGELYSSDFYSELYRILRPCGVLFHYTGNLGRRRGIDLARGVMRRLKEVGFEVRRYERGLGVLASKRC